MFSTLLNRRSFLYSGVLAAGAALAPSDASARTPAKDPSATADVIIVGYGAAGAAAAIEASDAGASVLILEKAPREHHCSTTRLSSGIYQCPDATIDRSVLRDYILSTYLPNGADLARHNLLPEPLAPFADAWADLAPETYTWLCGLDPDFRTASSPLFTTSRFVNLWHGIRPHIHARIATYASWSDFSRPSYRAPKTESLNGEALYNCLHAGVTGRKIPIRYEARASELLVEDGVVCGVLTEDGKPFFARKGVILTTGGFAFNRALRSALLPAAADRFWACTGSTQNTGDGITMALKLGAGLIKASAFFDRFSILLDATCDGVRLGVPLECLGRPHTFLVDNFGRRFTSESELQDIHQHYGYVETMLNFDDAALSYRCAPAWCVFDEHLFQTQPVATLGEGSTVCGTVDWRSNAQALEKGMIFLGRTIEDLARRIASHADNFGRMNPTNLAQTLERFNRFARDRMDGDFDRSPATMAPLTGPFYAVPVTIDVPHMAAGLLTDARRRVLDWAGRPLPGLFAAGEVAPVSRFMHDKGGHLSESMVFGRLAGRSAASAASL